MLDALWQDARFAVRSLRKTPGFTVAAVLMLALGIGATTAVVSAVDVTLVRPLPYDDPDRIVMVWEDMNVAGIRQNTPAPANFIDWLGRNRVFESMAATFAATVNITGDGAPEQVVGRRVTPNFLHVLGARPLLGRFFSEDEDRQSVPVVVISYRLWQRRYAADPAIVGKTITLNDAKSTVIGVMPRPFVFRNRDIDVWLPASFTPAQRANRTLHFLNVVARLRADVQIGQAREQFSVIAGELASEHIENRGVGVQIIPVRDDILGDTRQQLLVLSIAAACMLLIASANLAGLLLARTWDKRREIATRAALGATRARLIARMTVEGLILSGCGAIAGLAVAMGGIKLLAEMVPTTLGETAVPSFDARVLAFALVLTVVTGIAFSIVPAILSSRHDLGDDLKTRTNSGAGPRHHARSALLTFQVASTFVLLIGAGLMIQSLSALRGIDVGFETNGLLTMRTTLPVTRYSDPARRRLFYDGVLEGVKALPGVKSAAFASTLPFLSAGNTAGYIVDGRAHDPANPTDALFRVTTTDYLETLGVRVLEGRLPNPADGPDSPPVVVINKTFAERYWRNESPLGHRIALTSPGAGWMSIVGVVADVLETGYERGARPGMYVLASQTRRAADNLVIRVAGDPLAVASSTRAVIARVDPEQPVAAVRTMNDIIDVEVVDWRQQSILLSIFAASGLLLAAIGLYGLLSHMVAQQRQEIGIRLALGATPNRVKRTILTRGMAHTALGLAVGLLSAWLGMGTMRTLLVDVQPDDPRTFAIVTALLVAVSFIASWVPAQRATRVDPITALRME
jgi:predicted permease